jgi:hypothetical protein
MTQKGRKSDARGGENDIGRGAGTTDGECGNDEIWVQVKRGMNGDSFFIIAKSGNL